MFLFTSVRTSLNTNGFLYFSLGAHATQYVCIVFRGLGLQVISVFISFVAAEKQWKQCVYRSRPRINENQLFCMKVKRQVKQIIGFIDLRSRINEHNCFAQHFHWFPLVLDWVSLISVDVHIKTNDEFEQKNNKHVCWYANQWQSLVFLICCSIFMQLCWFSLISVV